MSTLLEREPTSAGPPRKLWTRSEFESVSDGELASQHLELVEGEIISKMGKDRPHTIALALFYEWLVQVFGFRFVNPEAPIDVATNDNRINRPEPDLIVVNRPHREILPENPQPEDLDLVVEVADSSLTFDLTTKARLYARAGITEYWVLDVAGRRLIVHREPRSGNYQSVSSYAEGQSIAPLTKSSAALLVSQVLP